MFYGKITPINLSFDYLSLPNSSASFLSNPKAISDRPTASVYGPYNKEFIQ